MEKTEDCHGSPRNLLAIDGHCVEDGNPSIYTLNMDTIAELHGSKIRKYKFGNENMAQGTPEKVIMVVGATGAGKTTWINAMLNYVLGVKFDDPVRFKLIHEETGASQAHSQTSSVTAYTLYHRPHFKFPYTLTIIDTPGFGDTKGIGEDQKITELIRSFFTESGNRGMDTIHAIGFVAQASLARLTYTQKYIFDSILALFGKDIADNMYVLATFSDAKKPPLMDSIKEAEMPFKGYFKFNNSAVFSQRDESDGDKESSFDKMFWDMGMMSFETFLNQIETIEGKSLLLTKEVLNERWQLEVFVEGIQRGIQLGLGKLEEMRREERVVQQFAAQIDANKDFIYTVTESKIVEIPIPRGQYVTNCLTCNFTCHFPCNIPNDADKSGCSAMSGGNCRICVKKCNWRVHRNMPYRLEIQKVQVTKTSNDLLEKYLDGEKKKMSSHQLMYRIMTEFEYIQFEVFEMTNDIKRGLNRLQEIALKPNPLSQVDYIDILIQSKKHEAKKGWQDEVEQLTTVREQAMALQQISKEGDPFSPYRKEITRIEKTSVEDKRVHRSVKDFMNFVKSKLS